MRGLGPIRPRPKGTPGFWVGEATYCDLSRTVRLARDGAGDVKIDPLPAQTRTIRRLYALRPYLFAFDYSFVFPRSWGRGIEGTIRDLMDLRVRVGNETVPVRSIGEAVSRRFVTYTGGETGLVRDLPVIIAVEDPDRTVDSATARTVPIDVPYFRRLRRSEARDLIAMPCTLRHAIVMSPGRQAWPSWLISGISQRNGPRTRKAMRDLRVHLLRVHSELSALAHFTSRHDLPSDINDRVAADLSWITARRDLSDAEPAYVAHAVLRAAERVDPDMMARLRPILLAADTHAANTEYPMDQSRETDFPAAVKGVDKREAFRRSLVQASNPDSVPLYLNVLNLLLEGDTIFENIQNSTVLNRSSLQQTGPQGVRSLLQKLAAVVRDEDRTRIDRMLKLLGQKRYWLGNEDFEMFDDIVNAPYTDLRAAVYVELLKDALRAADGRPPRRETIMDDRARSARATSQDQEDNVGDRFKNIKNSTIINRSIVENALNKYGSAGDDRMADALKTLIDHVEQSGVPEAAENLEGFLEEVEKPEPRKSRLTTFWKGLVDVLPSVAALGTASEKAVELIAN